MGVNHIIWLPTVATIQASTSHVYCQTNLFRGHVDQLLNGLQISLYLVFLHFKVQKYKTSGIFGILKVTLHRPTIHCEFYNQRPRSAELPISQTCLECQARVSSRESRRPPCRCARAQRRRSPPPASRWRGSRSTGSPWSTARERRGRCTFRINRYLDLDIQCCFRVI